MAPYKIAIIIPAYNEGDSIGWVINELNEVLSNDAEIIVVNDCSTDNTADSANEAGAHVVDLQVNHGYSKAIEKGLNYACDHLNADYLITMDADGQHDPSSVKKVLDFLKMDKFDLVVGKRERCARFSERLYGTYYKFKFGIDDPLCGLKGYRASVFYKYGKFESFDSIGTELLTWSLLNKYRIKQVDIGIRERKGEPRFGSLYSANKRIFKSLIKSFQYIKNNAIQ